MTLFLELTISLDTRVSFLLVPLTVTLHEAFFLLPSFAVAVITADPAFFAVTTPFEFTVTTALLLLFHENFLLEAFDGETAAFKVYDFPVFRLILFLFSLILDTLTAFFAAFTVTVQVYFFLFTVAVIFALPAFLPVTFPALLTEAIFEKSSRAFS